MANTSISYVDIDNLLPAEIATAVAAEIAVLEAAGFTVSEQQIQQLDTGERIKKTVVALIGKKVSGSIRKASILYNHTANDTGVLPIFRAESPCEIIAAYFRPESGFTAGAASEDLYLVKDDGNQGSTDNICFVEGTVNTVLSDRENEWDDATNGLPGVHSGTVGDYYTLAEGDWMYLQQNTNGAGSSMGWVLIEITYRLL